MNDLVVSFWNKRREILQFVGFTVAIGAIFLTISLPDNEKAKNALITIQFTWLLIITALLIVLAIIFIVYAYKANFNFEKKYSWDTQSIVGFVVLAVFYTMIKNLWKYLFALYSIQWKLLMGNISYLVGGTILIGLYEAIKRVSQKNNLVYKRLVINSSLIILYGVVSTLWYQLVKLEPLRKSFLGDLIAPICAGFLVYSFYLIYSFVVSRKKTN